MAVGPSARLTKGSDEAERQMMTQPASAKGMIWIPRRFVSVRAELLPAVSAGGEDAAGRGHLDLPLGVSLRGRLGAIAGTRTFLGYFLERDMRDVQREEGSALPA
jgi:hypothetical protein